MLPGASFFRYPEKFLVGLSLAVPLLAQKPTIDASEYAARRARLAKEIGTNAIFVAFSPRQQIRSGDQEWPFRQSDDLLYLTGIAANLALSSGRAAGCNLTMRRSLE